MQIEIADRIKFETHLLEPIHKVQVRWKLSRGPHDSRIFRMTFFIASAVGAVGGLFFSSYAGMARFDFSIEVGLIGFSAAVVGGLGSMPGAIIGSLLIAGLDTLVQAVVANGASYRLVFVFLLVIAVLVFRPSGLLGRTAIEKV